MFCVGLSADDTVAKLFVKIDNGGKGVDTRAVINLKHQDWMQANLKSFLVADSEHA